VLQLFEDLLDPDYAKTIEKTMLSNAFPYYFFADIDYGKGNDVYNFGFSHTFVDQFAESRSDFLELVLPVAFAIGDALDLKLTQLIRIRGVMLTPIGIGYNHVRHTDLASDPDSLTAVYYVNDSDGATTIYNGEDVVSVNPKQNSAVVFDTHMEHHGAKPVKTASRVVLNINFRGEPQ